MRVVLCQVDGLGLPRQVEIFWRVADRTKAMPPVLDIRDVLEEPRRMLGLLCDALVRVCRRSRVAGVARRRAARPVGLGLGALVSTLATSQR